MHALLRSGAALALLAAIGFASAALADPPDQFLNQAARANRAEIMIGRMAQRNSDDPAVRRFADMIVNDHQNADDQLRRVADRMNIRVDSRPMQDAFYERDQLSGMRGHGFDREFVHFMIRAHRQAIDQFQDEASERNGPATWFARNQLPTLRRHLDMAMMLGRQINRYTER